MLLIQTVEITSPISATSLFSFHHHLGLGYGVGLYGYPTRRFRWAITQFPIRLRLVIINA